MISNINSATANLAYTNASKSVEPKANAKVGATTQNGNSRIEKLKESIDSGEYKIDLAALANKMADELM